MYLHRIHLDLRCREARRDMADPYQLHSTLCRAFSKPEAKCAPGEYLWRLEPETNAAGFPRILVQSRSIPDWNGIGVYGWLYDTTKPIDLKSHLQIESLEPGKRFRYRLRANPCVCRNGKRVGLFNRQDQRDWLLRTGAMHGFKPETMHLSQEQMMRGRKHGTGVTISVFSVLYDGMLEVTDTGLFRAALCSGLGHGKAMGLGLLSIAPCHA